jgi:Flp pilus assembly protein TadG
MMKQLMNVTPISRRPSRHRRGTTVVETAFVLPVFLMFVFVIIEFGHAQMIKNMLRGACREAARMGSTEGSSTTDVEARVRQILGGAVSAGKVQVFVKDAAAFDAGGNPPETSSELAALPSYEVANGEQGDLFLVRATVNYNDVAVIPFSIPIMGNFLDNIVLDGQAFARHE